MNTGTSWEPTILCYINACPCASDVQKVHSCFTSNSPELYKQCNTNKEVTLITWTNLIKSGPKKLHAKEYCMIILISSSKVNKTKLQCLGMHIVRLKVYRY